MIDGESVDTAMIIAGGAALALVTAVLIFHMPLRARLGVLAVLAVPQLIVPGLPESLSVFQAWVAMCALTMWARERPKFPSIYGKLLVGLAGAALLAAAYSPEIILAVISAGQILSLFVIALHAAHLLREDPAGLCTVLKWLSVAVIVESVMVCAFRVNPALEMQFLQMDATRFLVGTDKLHNFFNGSRDNVYDPIKAGGIWLNANTASMFLGISACAFVAAGKRFRVKWFYFAALVAAIGVAFTGSKTGAVLLLTMPVVAIIVPRLLRPGGRGWIGPALLMSWPAYLAAEHIAGRIIPSEVLVDSAGTLATRNVIWETAGILFSANPFLGLGFGGWAQQFIYASGASLGRHFPPHNIFILQWSDAGMIGALLLVIFVLAVLIGHVRMMARTPKHESSAWGFGFAAFLWLFIHGMADAVTFYGDLRAIIVPGILLGFLIFASQKSAEAAGHASDEAVTQAHTQTGRVRLPSSR